ncbi:hypothetical protein [Flavisolibacter ginsenosidimutans]|nr:hypothetical protein [Flavisolibacter ginsenosidimutans]
METLKNKGCAQMAFPPGRSGWAAAYYSERTRVRRNESLIEVQKLSS